MEYKQYSRLVDDQNQYELRKSIECDLIKSQAFSEELNQKISPQKKIDYINIIQYDIRKSQENLKQSQIQIDTPKNYDSSNQFIQTTNSNHEIVKHSISPSEQQKKIIELEQQILNQITQQYNYQDQNQLTYDENQQIQFLQSLIEQEQNIINDKNQNIQLLEEKLFLDYQDKKIQEIYQEQKQSYNQYNDKDKLLEFEITELELLKIMKEEKINQKELYKQQQTQFEENKKLLKKQKEDLDRLKKQKEDNIEQIKTKILQYQQNLENLKKTIEKSPDQIDQQLEKMITNMEDDNQQQLRVKGYEQILDTDAQKQHLIEQIELENNNILRQYLELKSENENHKNNSDQMKKDIKSQLDKNEKKIQKIKILDQELINLAKIQQEMFEFLGKVLNFTQDGVATGILFQQANKLGL